MVGGFHSFSPCLFSDLKPQAHRALERTGLPTTTSTISNRKLTEKLEKLSAGNGHNYQEHERGVVQRTPFTKIEHGFRHFLAPSWTGTNFERCSAIGSGGVHGGNVLVEGLREDEGEKEGDGETGSWVGGDDSDTRVAASGPASSFLRCDRLPKGLAQPTELSSFADPTPGRTNE